MSVLNSYSDDVTLLHEAIEAGDLVEVKSSLSNLRIDKNYFDANNVSAAAVAIKWGKHEIYELLVAKGIFLGPHEWMDEATSGQNRSRKENLREIHRRYFNDPNLKHLINLITSTKLSHEASPSERREHLRLISESLEDLNGLKSIEPILKVASTSRKLRIVFDFNRDSVEFIDPVQDRNVMGICYTKNDIIYVGAKDLKEKAKCCEVLGVLIHELTHFVMKLIYGNEAKPYQRGDQKMNKKFSQVVVDTSAKKESEPYIESVYDYPVSRYHAELIVRVPHLTALYKDDEDKTIEVQEEFSELFKFYDENTLVDLKREFPLLEVKHEIRELNELCGSLAILKESDIEMSPQALDGLDLNSLSNDKILFISSNCSRLTLSSICQQASDEINFETSYIFADLNLMKNAKIFDLAAKALALSTNPSLIIDCQGDVKFDAVMRIVKKLKDKKINQKVIFVLDNNLNASSDIKLFEVVHSWNHLTSNFQQKLLERKVEFHGTEMLIKDFLNDLSSIDSIPFQDFLNDQTIVIGKNRKFEGSEKLIERKFLPSDSETIDDSEDYTIEHNLDELLTFTREHQTILISDEPGMGKSTSLKMLHSELKKKNSSLWLVFMDLIENFEAFQVSRLEVRKREDIVKFLIENILKIERFDAEVFRKLFNEDRVVLLMDGLDEICPSYKQFIFSLMKDIQKFSKNRLWISTRPHLVEELKQELNPKIFTLKPFSKANRREFFEKHFIEDQNSEEKLKEIESFLGKLPYRSQTNVICNPLVMRMIVEIIDEDPNLKLCEANLFDIYDRFTRKMIEKCHDKGQEAKKDIVNWVGNSNIIDFYQQQAFLTCFDSHNIKIGYDDIPSRRQTLIDPQFDHVNKPPLDEIVRVGLMFASSSENLNFIHQTFAEFFVAKFFYEVIFKFSNLRAKKYLNNAIEFLLKTVLKEHRCEFIRNLLDNALDGHEKLTLKKFPPSTLKIVQDKMERAHFELLVRYGYCNLIKFIVMHLHPDGQELLFTKSSDQQNLIMVAVKYQSIDFIERFFTLLHDLNADKFQKMLSEQKIENQNVFFFAASNFNSEVFKFVVEFCETFMTSDELSELLIQRGNRDKTILYCALNHGRNVDIIIEILTQRLSFSHQKTLLKVLTDDMKYNLMQYAALYNNSLKNFESLFAFMRKVLDSQDVENYLLHENLRGFKAFDLALINKNELVFDATKNFYLEVFGEENMRKIILNRNDRENLFREIYSYVQRICSPHEIYYYDGTFKRFLSLVMKLFTVDSIPKEFFLITGEDGKTLLEYSVMNFGIEDFDAVCSLLEAVDRVEILQQKNSRGECAFHWASLQFNLEIFRKVQKCYGESFDEPNLRKMILSCDKSWMLDVVKIHGYENSETFTELCHYLKDLFKDAEEAESLEDFFMFADELGQTAFMAAAERESQRFEDLFALTKELFTIGTVKKILLLKDLNGATALTYPLIEGFYSSIFKFVKRAFEESFEREQMQEICLSKVQDVNILSLSIELKSRLDLFEMFCNHLVKLFEDEAYKLKPTFVSVDYLDETVLMKAAKESGGNYFEILVDVIEKVFDKNDVVEMLCQSNQEGKTAYDFSIENEKKIFETVKNFYIKTLEANHFSFC